MPVCDHFQQQPVDDLGAGEDADPCADPQQAADVGDQVKHRHPPVGLVLWDKEINMHEVIINTSILPSAVLFPK